MRTDPVADFLTHIRNAIHARKDRVDTPWSRLKEALAKVLQAEGFIGELNVVEEGERSILRLWIRDPTGTKWTWCECSFYFTGYHGRSSSTETARWR